MNSYQCDEEIERVAEGVTDALGFVLCRFYLA
jgi:hypothetical protein